MGNQHTPSADELVKLVEQLGTVQAVGESLGMEDSKLQRLIRKYEREGVDLRARLRVARGASAAPKADASRLPWPADSELARLVRTAPSLQSAAQSLGVKETSLRNRCNSRGIDMKALRASERTVISGDSAVLNANELKDAEELMRERGFSVDEWRVDRAVVNEWGLSAETGEPYKQLKLNLVRKIDLGWVFPAADPKPVRPKPKVRKATSTRPQTVVLIGDHQAPYNSEPAHQAFLRWVEDVKPDRGVHVGDLIDLPTVSRHADSAVYNASVQDCLNAGYRILSDMVLASPQTSWQYMLGNHDQRLRSELLNRAERMFGIRPADIPGQPQSEDALSLRRLLRLDDLRIELVNNEAGYQHNEVRLTDTFAVRHGWLTGQNPSKRSMEVLNASVAVGHTHAKRSHWRTTYDHEGIPTVHSGTELGTMSQTGSGIGFTVRPDWQPGWATVQVWPDGLTQVDHAVYHEREDCVLWRNQRW